ncbi:hypothetical protein [Dactylosporangium darangshiense]|uniref:FXSXX-COOH protein n=1 Tax=Dactylosporangium darangshiense TaxID=579108 RepID=A0ABP8DM37_9ACTN
MDLGGAAAASRNAEAGLAALTATDRISLAQLADPAVRRPAAFAMTVQRLVEQATDGHQQVSRFQSAP